MNEKRQKELDQLNAFIDGELDVDARAAVTARAARDPDYAGELATLNQLKAAVAESVPVPDIPLPQQPPTRWLHPVAMAVAASVTFFVTMGVVWIALNDRPTGSNEFSLDSAIEMHRTWIPQTPGDAAKTTVQPVSTALHPNVPDLSANGLDLAYAGARKAAGSEDTLVVGYLGSRGCRLTMLVNHVDRIRKEPVVDIQSGVVLASLWYAGSLRYVLLAEGMAKARFRLIADSVRRASFERLPLDQNTRTALIRSRAKSPPCHA